MAVPVKKLCQKKAIKKLTRKWSCLLRDFWWNDYVLWAFSIFYLLAGDNYSDLISRWRSANGAEKRSQLRSWYSLVSVLRLAISAVSRKLEEEPKRISWSRRKRPKDPLNSTVEKKNKRDNQAYSSCVLMRITRLLPTILVPAAVDL